MLNFKSYLREEKNTHMEHLEDNVLNAGVAGAREALDFIEHLRDTLQGSTGKKVNMSVKWDGAPAIFAGVDPTDGKFFVAKKGVFNKTPKVYKTPADVDADTSGELNEKLKDALKYCSKLGIKGVVQGDFLFSKKDLKVQTINGQKFVTFHPNTIVYAYPFDSASAVTIKRARIGIVWHTSYSGSSFETMKATYNQAITASLRPSKDVWCTDAIYRDASGTAAMTKTETNELNDVLDKAEACFRGIDKKSLDSISDNEEFLILVKTYNNTKVRAGEKITDTSKHVDGLVDYITGKFTKDAAKLKTEKGKAGVEAKKNSILSYMANTPKEQMVKIFDLMNYIVDCKHILVYKLQALKKVDTFLKTNAGFRKTGHEGFVVSDHLNKTAVKFIDRNEFSFANFSPDVLKGWMR
jgi:hypothetical protein